MPPRAKKKQRRCARSRPVEVLVGAVADEDAPDWVNAVFGHPDVGPLVLAHIDDLEDAAHFSRACKLLHAKDTIVVEAARIYWDAMKRCNAHYSVTLHACVSGNLRLIKFVHEHIIPATKDCASAAASRGHIHVLAYLHSVGVAMDEEVSMSASSHSAKGLEMLKWLQAHDVPWDNTVLVGALNTNTTLEEEGNVVAILQYIFDREFAKTGVEFRLRSDSAGWRLKECVEDAARFGSIACIKVLQAHGGRSSLAACREAVEYGHLDTLKYLSTEVMDILGARSGCSILLSSIKNNRLGCFQYLYPLCAAYLDGEDGEMLIQTVLGYGRAAMLRYMTTQGVEYSHDNIQHLLHHDGNEEAILMMAREYGHRFTRNDLRQCLMLKQKKNYKAMHSKLRIPWPDDTLALCAASNYTDGFMYALEHGAKIEDDILLRCCMQGAGQEIEALVKYHNVKPDANCMYALAKIGESCIGIFLFAWMADKRWKTAMERQLLLAKPTTEAEKANHGPPYARFMMEVFNRRIQV